MDQQIFRRTAVTEAGAEIDLEAFRAALERQGILGRDAEGNVVLGPPGERRIRRSALGLRGIQQGRLHFYLLYVMAALLVLLAYLALGARLA